MNDQLPEHVQQIFRTVIAMKAVLCGYLCINNRSFVAYIVDDAEYPFRVATFNPARGMDSIVLCYTRSEMIEEISTRAFRYCGA